MTITIIGIFIIFLGVALLLIVPRKSLRQLSFLAGFPARQL